MVQSSANEKASLLERGLRWDVHFNRGLGMVAVGVAGIASVAGAPVVAGYAALFAGGNFVAAEVEKRMADGMTQRRLGAAAIKPNLAS